MTSPTVFTQWSTIQPFVGANLPAWVPPLDALRIASYQKYEEIYWTSEEGFTNKLRGDNENPVLMPTARTIIDTVNRYVAPGFTYTVTGEDATAVQVAQLAFTNLFTRENFFSQFNGSKRYGLIHGDWYWHVLADPLKLPGRRLSIKRVDPGAVFQVFESDILPEGDPDKIIRVHIAEQILINGDVRVSRLTYERLYDPNTGLPLGVQRSHGIFKLEKWWQATVAETWILNDEMLPPEIKTIPVYHLKNFDATAPYGSSEMRGLESVLLGINQTISDEDLTLGVEGLGIYATDGGAPVDENGNEVEWIMGPGRVLTQANNLKRINGVGSVVPYGDHYNRLLEAVRMAVGASDAATGKIDSATAESGIALALQLAPILAYSAEKDQTIIDVHSQMFFDLCFWLQVYEDLPLTTTGDDGQLTAAVVITPIIGSKIPANIKEVIERVTTLRSASPPIISLQTAHAWLAAVGLVLAPDELALIENEQSSALNALGPLATQDLVSTQRTTAELTGAGSPAGHGTGANSGN